MQVYIRKITKTVEERHEDCDCMQQFDEDIETRTSQYTHSTQLYGISYYIWLKQSNYQPDNSLLDENWARYVDDYDVDVTVSYRFFSLIWE